MDSQCRRWILRSLTLSTLLCLAVVPMRAQASDTEDDGPQQASTDVSRPHFVDNDTILRMAKAGLGDEVLLHTIQLQPGHYDTTPDDLIRLKAAGLSDKVIAAMQVHGTPLGQSKSTPTLHVRDNANPSIMATAVNPSALAPGVDEIGVYYKDKDGEYIEMHVERVIFKSGGWVKSTLTHNIIGKDMNGHIDGVTSPLVLSPGTEILVYAPYGTSAEEYDFLQFRQHSDNREFRVMTGGVFHSTSGSQRDDLEFKPVKIGPQMYTYTLPTDLPKGEFGVLPPGSSNIQGISGSGKIFTFSIREENHADKKDIAKK